jgi:hypothetical protein
MDGQILREGQGWKEESKIEVKKSSTDMRPSGL